MSTPYGPDEIAALQEKAKRHLWLHFTRMSSYADGDVPVIVRGDGAYVYDQRGKRYLDGLAGLFVSQIGHGRTEVAEAGARQARELAYFPLWSYAHPQAVALADRLAAHISIAVSFRSGFRPCLHAGRCADRSGTWLSW